MMVLVTYDVCTADENGPARLRHVARICRNYGIRVQNSVFECHVTPAQRVHLESELRGIIDSERDSIRIYDLGSFQNFRVMHIGTKAPVDVNGLLMF